MKDCAYSDEYPCEKLSAFLKNAPEAEATLDEISKKGSYRTISTYQNRAKAVIMKRAAQ